ncbi:hypothetical protein E4U23_008000 [Claviceps purpurea]|nr:hypothetical protein E4U23_008000 [Claviceps purpurea]
MWRLILSRRKGGGSFPVADESDKLDRASKRDVVSAVELEQSALFLTNRLFQQYAIDAFIACETTRIPVLTGSRAIRTQENIRADLFVGLEDVLNRDDAVPENLVHRVILPSSFTGSDRHMRQLCQDSGLHGHGDGPESPVSWDAVNVIKDVGDPRCRTMVMVHEVLIQLLHMHVAPIN